MDDRLCFVQFLHPGGEPPVRAAGELEWNVGKLHKRKFVCSRGDYRTAPDSPTVEGEELVFWGEWEPQSVASRIRHPVPDGPVWVHAPFFDPPAPDEWAQNTDPFVFGPQFQFTGCQQHVQGHQTQLARLRRGSVILFGSGKGRQFVLDTVFVVGDRAIDHRSGNQTAVLDGQIASEYRQVTIDRWYAGYVPRDQIHRLYFGATPEQNVGGMFSFFPCKRHNNASNGFARPRIRVDGHVTQTATQKFKRSYISGIDHAAELWRDVVDQVLAADLRLGVRADLPQRSPVRIAGAAGAPGGC
jgi:hypothetical protein